MNDDTNHVKAAVPRGFRDLLPDEMLVRNEVIRKIEGIYQSYGYLPLDTPILEHLPTLIGAGGEETDNLIFDLKTPEGQKLGLRFDLTVPFARIVAQYHPHRIRLPFRRYHIGPVFRADSPQPEQGRFRQFTQFDIDIAGTSDVAADAEIVAVLCNALESLSLKPVAGSEQPGYYIRFNSRKLVDAFLQGIGIVEVDTMHQVLRVLDKRDKLSMEDFVKELGPGRYDRSRSFVDGVGLDVTRIDRLVEYVRPRGGGRRAILAELQGLLPATEKASEATTEVEVVIDNLEAAGIGEAAAVLDPSLARGLAYYTGTVFEGTLVGGGVGSIVGGGRYDGLVGRFSNEVVPAVGASIGLDRLMTGLEVLGLTVGAGLANEVRTIVLSIGSGAQPVATAVATELRQAGIPTEVYLGMGAVRLAKQLSYANARGLSVAVILGDDEIHSGVVTIKDLRAGRQLREGIENNEAYRGSFQAGQSTIPRTELVATVGGLLEAEDVR